MTVQLVTHGIAMLASLLAMVLLATLVRRVGGSFGTMLRWTVVGIFLAVFVHSVVELLAALGVVDESTLMLVMGLLVSGGSACFVVAGYVGHKTLT